MKTVTRLLLIVCLVLPMLAACKKEEAKQDAVAAPLVVPTGTGDEQWGAYLQDVVKRNMDGINSNPYLYYLPVDSSAEFQGYYDRQLEAAQGALMRGVVEGNMLAFGSPSSAKMADLVVAAFPSAQPNSLKGVRVLFVGNAADNERVKAAVAASAAEYKFVEVK